MSADLLHSLSQILTENAIHTQEFPSRIELAHDKYYLGKLLQHQVTDICSHVAQVRIAAQRVENEVGRPTLQTAIAAFLDLKDVKIASMLKKLQQLHAQYKSPLNTQESTKTFLHDLPIASCNAITSFLSLIMSPSSFKVISLSLTQHGNAFLALPSRLKPYLTLLHAANGPTVLAQFAEILLVDLMNEMELAQNDVARIKDIDTVFIALLDALHDLDISVNMKMSDNTRDQRGTGIHPFCWGPSVELAVLELLQARKYYTRLPEGSTHRPALKTSHGHSNSVSGIQTALSTVGEGIYSTFITGPSRIFASPATPEPGSNYKPRYTSPSNQSALTLAILKASIAFIRALVPSCSLSTAPLVLHLSCSLLSKRFPESKSPKAHKKIQLLILVRFYAFMKLSKLLSTLSTSVDICTSSIISGQDVEELLLPLHNRVYMAVIEAAGVAQSESKMTEDVLARVETSQHTEALRLLKELRVAARALAQTFSAPTELVVDNVPERPFLINKYWISDLFELGPPLIFASNSPSFPSLSAFPGLKARSPSFKRTKTSSSDQEFEQFGEEPSLMSQLAVALSQIKALPRGSSGGWHDYALLYAFKSHENLVDVSSLPILRKIEQIGVSSPNTTPSNSGRVQRRPQISPNKITGPEESDIIFLRSAIISAVQSVNDVQHMEILPAIQHACDVAGSRHDFAKVALFQQSILFLNTLRKTFPVLARDDYKELLARVFKPFEEEHARNEDHSACLKGLSRRLNEEVAQALGNIRSAIGQIDSLRTRSYFQCQINGPHYSALLSRLYSFSSRTAKVNFEASNANRKWYQQNEVQLYFEASQEDVASAHYLETLAEIQRACENMSSLEFIISNEWFKAEAAVIQAKVKSEEARDEGFLDSSLKTVNYLLSAPTFVFSSLVRAHVVYLNLFILTLTPQMGENHVAPLQYTDFNISRDGAVPGFLTTSALSVQRVDDWSLSTKLNLVAYSISHCQSLNLLAFDVPSWFENAVQLVSKHELPTFLSHLIPFLPMLMGAFTFQTDPLKKLAALADLVRCVAIFSSSQAAASSSANAGSPQKDKLQFQSLTRHLSSRAILEEADPFTEQALQDNSGLSSQPIGSMRSVSNHVEADMLLNQLEAVFAYAPSRPSGLLCHFQLINTLMPEHCLNLQANGKAFYDCALAVLSLKRDAVTALVNQAVNGLASGLDDNRIDARAAILVGAAEGNLEAKELKPSFV